MLDATAWFVALAWCRSPSTEFDDWEDMMNEDHDLHTNKDRLRREKKLGSGREEQEGEEAFE